MAGTSIFGNARAKQLFSQDCQLCGVRTNTSLCRDCERDLPYQMAGSCPRCAAQSSTGQLCGACLAEAPLFDETVAAFGYAFPLDRLLQSYKFNENLSLTAVFSAALRASVRRHLLQPGAALPDRVIALPLARRRLAERGFNQSALLAESVAKDLGIAYAPQGLLKVRDTPPQAGLDRAARLKNMRGAFDCGESLTGLRIAIVDDVMTTGATLSEAAKVLKKAGASYVSAWVVARADSAGAHISTADATVPF
ncbi:MAG: ComF family protein [Betaproteobacteria bacterium]|nr:ComF family protein [Betaproteobacteria bacterium]